MDEKLLKLQNRIQELEHENSILKAKLNTQDASSKKALISERELKAALASMSDAVFISDAKGNFIEFNEAFATFHKFQNKQECAKTLSEYPVFLDVYYPNGEFVPLEQWVVPRAIRGESGRRIEFTLVRKDTKEKWIGSYNYAPLLNSEGVIIGSVVTARDITEIKKIHLELVKAKESAEKNRHLLRNIIDSSTDFIFVKDRELKTLLCNHTFAQSLGKKPDDLIGKTDIENGWDPELVKGNPEKGIKGYEEDDLEALSGKVVQITDQVIISGNTHYLDTVKIPLKGENNQIFGVLGIGRDITKRRQAELTIKKQQKLLKEAEQLSQMGSWEWDIDNDIAYWSDGLYKIFKRSPQEAAPKWAQQSGYYLKESYEELGRAVEECAKTGTPYDVTVQAIRSDGEIRTCVSIGRGTENHEGRITRLWGTFHDITERRQIEQALQESEEKYRSLAENTADGLVVINNEKGSIEYVSPAYTKLFGYTQEDELQRDYQKVPELFHPDDRDRTVKSISDAVEKKMETLTFEYRGKHKQGHYVWRRDTSKFIYSDNGELLKLYVVCRDITEQKRAEEQLIRSEENFKALFNLNPDYVNIVRLSDSKIVAINENFANELSKKPDEIIGKTTDDLSIWVEAEQRRQLYSEILNKGGSKNYEATLRRKDGSIFTGIISTRVVDYYGEPHILFVTRDISELKEVEQLLKDSNTTKDKFFSIIAHDLNSPFQGLLGYLDLLKDDYDDFDEAQRKEMLNSIHESASGLFALIRNLLEWSSSKRGKIEYNPEVVSLTYMVEDIVKVLARQVAEKKLQVHNNIPGEFEVYADKNMVRTIFRNLISNAEKFSYEGGIITIDSAKEGDKAVISIADEGMGIEEQNIEKLFKAGTNFSSTGTKNEKGTGLGLVLCNEFVENHNGKIWVESEPGKGTAVFFTLPLRPPE